MVANRKSSLLHEGLASLWFLRPLSSQH